MPEELLSRTPPAADHRIHYGPGPQHFGDLRLPAFYDGRQAHESRPAPVLVFLHGGWWKAAYDLTYGGHLCAALKAAGIASWSLEYRRVGDAGGGYPGTFEDVAAGFDALADLAGKYPLDLSRVVVAGHSAGGQLAFWLAGRPHLPPATTLRLHVPRVPIHGLISLAGAVDLRLVCDLAGYLQFAHDKDEVYNLMGGSPAKFPDRYREGNPGELLPLNVPQWLIQGEADDQIPPTLPRRWAERGRKLGEPINVDMLAGADHFDIVDPQSAAWPRVLATIRRAFA